jgi:hypothetical protein
LIQDRRFRGDLLIAIIAAVASLTAALTGGVFQLLDDDSQPEACAVLVDRVADLVKEHPELARLYASDVSGLPRLTSGDENDRCGNVDSLVDRMLGE